MIWLKPPENRCSFPTTSLWYTDFGGVNKLAAKQYVNESRTCVHSWWRDSLLKWKIYGINITRMCLYIQMIWNFEFHYNFAENATLISSRALCACALRFKSDLRISLRSKLLLFSNVFVVDCVSDNGRNTIISRAKLVLYYTRTASVLKCRQFMLEYITERNCTSLQDT